MGKLLVGHPVHDAGAAVALDLFGQQDRHGTGRRVGCRACRRGSVGVLKLGDDLGAGCAVQMAISPPREEQNHNRQGTGNEQPRADLTLVVEFEERAAHETAGNRAADWNPRVEPARSALIVDGQQGVHEARTEVTGGVQRVAGLTTQTDDEHGDHETEGEGLEHVVEVEREFYTAADGRLEVHTGVQCREDQHERADHFGEGVGEVVVNSGHGTENTELNFLVGGCFPVRQVVEVDQPGTNHCAEDLGDDVAGDFLPGELAVGCQADGYGGVKMAAGVCVGGVDTEGDGETPSEGDGEEVVAVAFGAAKFDVGDDAAADGAHDERTEEFGEVGANGVHGVSFR